MKKNLFIVVTIINVLIIFVLIFFLIQQRTDLAESKKQIDMCMKEKAIMRMSNKKLEKELRIEKIESLSIRYQNQVEKEKTKSMN